MRLFFLVLKFVNPSLEIKMVQQMKVLITKLADPRPDSCKLSPTVHIHALIPPC